MELTKPEEFFPDQLNELRLIVEPDFIWDVKNPKLLTFGPFGSYACSNECTDVLASVFDPMLDFSLGHFSKAKIFKLSEDLTRAGTQLVREGHPTYRTDHPACFRFLAACTDDRMEVFDSV